MVSNAVELHSRRTANEEPACSPAESCAPALREEALELDQARVHHERASCRDRLLSSRQAEWILDHDARLGVAIAPARDVPQDVPSQGASTHVLERRREHSEPTDSLHELASRRPKAGTELDLDADAKVVSFSQLPPADVVADPLGNR
jgi:hypothetical protein